MRTARSLAVAAVSFAATALAILVHGGMVAPFC